CVSALDVCRLKGAVVWRGPSHQTCRWGALCYNWLLDAAHSTRFVSSATRPGSRASRRTTAALHGTRVCNERTGRNKDYLHISRYFCTSAVRPMRRWYQVRGDDCLMRRCDVAFDC
uniref:Secreted protein n=1 Tax=Haemonchus contortus TaxID=6289 RepID=A0A7I4Z3A2_HAECO